MCLKRRAQGNSNGKNVTPFPKGEPGEKRGQMLRGRAVGETKGPIDRVPRGPDMQGVGGKNYPGKDEKASQGSWDQRCQVRQKLSVLKVEQSGKRWSKESGLEVRQR